MNEPASVSGIGFALFLALGASLLAFKAGFYRLPPKSTPYPLTFREVLGAFATYAFVAFVFLPVLVLLISYSTFGALKGEGLSLPKTEMIWLQVGAFFFIFFALIGVLFLMKKESSHHILWGEKKENSMRNLLLGLLTLAISYPVLLFVNLTLNYLTLHFFGKSGIEQAAVRQLKTLTETPLLFTAMAVVVIFIVPFVEELLFRGFLQTYLKRYLGRGGAIVTTGALFSAAHYAKGQGVGNIELILSLFVLACYLGFLYERQKSLLAPYGLHMAFNASTILAIAWS